MLAARHSYLRQCLSALAGLIALTGMTPNAPAQCQLQKLLADDGAGGDEFGFSVAISGDTAVIGAALDDDLGTNSGSAYVFERVSGIWTQAAKLTAADGAPSDFFGGFVALSGETAMIGVPFDDDLGSSSGSAYVFEKVGGVWTQTAKLNAGDGAAADEFGGSVSLSGDTAVIGARFDEDLGFNSGSAYVFEKLGGVWTQTAKLNAADGAASDVFGDSVALSGATVIIGATGDDDLGSDSGSAYVFEKVGGLWTQMTKLHAADGAANDRFGGPIVLSGNTAVVGDPSDDDLGHLSGSAYVFEKVGGVWTQTAKLNAADGASGDNFGRSVAVSGATAMIGASEDDDLGSGSGSTYVFEKFAGLWTQTTKLNAADGAASDGFGTAVAVSGTTTLIGAYRNDDRGSESGSAYVFVASGDDCNGNSVFDACDISSSTSADCNVNGIPDECDPDLDGDGVIDDCDNCVLPNPAQEDCNNNGIGDACDIADCAGAPPCSDCNTNGVPDECDISSGTRTDCNANGIPDGCETDTDGDGVIDDCDPCPLDKADADTDGDGVCDTGDLCPETPLGLLVDLDGCTLTTGPCCFAGTLCIDGTDRQTCKAFPDGVFQGEGLTCGDPDGDGVVGCADGCPLDPSKSDPGVCGCGVPDDDDGDLDGVVDCNDHCLQTPLGVPVNVCGCAEVGACCAAGGGCLDDIERTICVMIAGVYQGDGSICADGCSFGDQDADGDVDLGDVGAFQHCFTGNGGQVATACMPFDVDGCGSIDLDDFAALMDALTGPTGPTGGGPPPPPPPPPPPICGNGVLESGEECDDGNIVPGDGCDENCMIEQP